MRLPILVLALLPACSALTPVQTCTDATAVLVDGPDPFTCATAKEATAYVRLLAGRAVFGKERGRIVADLVARYRIDPEDTKADLVQVAAIVKELEDTPGLAVAELRSTRAWEALNGQGPFDAASYPEIDQVTRSRIAVWASDADDKLVLTEQDIAGWISFASLCREVQAGGPLKLSIANRELLYRDVADRFADAPRAEQIGMVAMGPFWPAVGDRWQRATYEGQQAWIKEAALPPPMTATSLGYASGVFELPFRTHADTVHKHFGPLRLDAAR